jgi:hypothetical protein
VLAPRGGLQLLERYDEISWCAAGASVYIVLAGRQAVFTFMTANKLFISIHYQHYFVHNKIC